MVAGNRRGAWIHSNRRYAGRLHLGDEKMIAATNLQPHNDRQRQIQLLSSIDDALSDDITLHYSAKNIDENRLDIGVSCHAHQSHS